MSDVEEARREAEQRLAESRRLAEERLARVRGAVESDFGHLPRPGPVLLGLAAAAGGLVLALRAWRHRRGGRRRRRHPG